MTPGCFCATLSHTSDCAYRNRSFRGTTPSHSAALPPTNTQSTHRSALSHAEAMLRSAGKIMSRIRKHLIVSRADPVAEMASEVREGLETLARAICALAVERHAKDPGHHRELAAVLFIDCANNFHDVKIRPEMRDWMAKLLNIDPRNTEKWANRR